MSSEPSIFKRNAYHKLGSVGFITGAVLVLIGSLLVPRAGDLGNVIDLQRAYGEQPVLLQASALVITLGFWAVIAGTSGIRHSIQADGAAWSQLGFAFHVLGVAVWTVGMSLDISYPAAIVNWLGAPPESKDIAYSVVTTLSPLGFGRGLFPLNLMINWLSFAFLSIGMLLSAVYPRWLAWSGLILGNAGALLGIAMTFTGREALIGVFVGLMALTLLWWLTLGIWIARKAW